MDTSGTHHFPSTTNNKHTLYTTLEDCSAQSQLHCSLSYFQFSSSSERSCVYIFTKNLPERELASERQRVNKFPLALHPHTRKRTLQPLLCHQKSKITPQILTKTHQSPIQSSHALSTDKQLATNTVNSLANKLNSLCEHKLETVLVHWKLKSFNFTVSPSIFTNSPLAIHTRKTRNALYTL